MKTFPVALPEDLPPAVALALFETLHNLTNAVWNLRAGPQGLDRDRELITGIF